MKSGRIATAIRNAPGGRQAGIALLETLFALAMLAILGATVLPALSNAANVNRLTGEMVNMDNLGRAQMEYTKNAAYVYGSPDVLTYARIDDPLNPDFLEAPDGYSVEVVGHALHQPDDGIQEITVTVNAGPRSIELKGYKVDR